MLGETSSSSYGYVAVKDLMVERNIYAALTKMSYRSDEQISLSNIVNDILKEYLHTYVLSKRMGHMLLSKDVIRIAINNMTDEQLKEASAANAVRYKEGAVLEHGKPSLMAYLELIKAFAKANKFDIEISKNPETNNQVLIMSFRMGPKFTQFKGNTYKILLQEFADIDKMEITDASIYIEYRPKKVEKFHRN